MSPTVLILSLVSTIGFGLIAVFVTQTSRKIGPVPALFLFQVLEIPLFAFLLPFAPPFPTNPTILPIVAVAALFSFNYLLFLHAAKIGNLAVVGPIGQLYMVVTAILGVVFLHESFGLGKLLSILLIMTGVILLGLQLPKKKERVFRLLAGVPHSFLSSIGTGIYLYLLAIFSRANGWFVTVITIRITIALTTFVLLLVQRYKFSTLRRQTPWKSIGAAAILDAVAFSLYNYAISYYEVSTVTIITSLQAAVIVLFSWIVFKERLNKQQVVGLVVALAGLISLQLN